MKTIFSITSILAITAAFSMGCGSSDDNTNPTDSGSGSDSNVTTDSGTRDTATTDTATTDSGGGDTPSDTPGFPAVPTLGTQVDRMGRPAINTALNHPFDPTSSTKNAAKDAYNQDKDPTNWVKSTTPYTAQFMANLGILDSLDGTCGNQLAYKGSAPAADSYSTLAGVLVADMLWLKTDATTCTLNDSPTLPSGYLAVEANALGVTNTDCGGRALSYDVMNISYALLSAGVGGLSGPLAHLDGITTVPDRSKGTTFPYLAAPH